jgi:RNase P subunit RPR2
MPPFVTTKCPSCKKSNRFDLAELKTTNTMVFKKLTLHSAVVNEEEFSVTCQQCGRKFKFALKGDENGEEK